MTIVDWRVEVVALLTVASVAASPVAAVCIPARPSTFVTVSGYSPPSSCFLDSVEVTKFLTDQGLFSSVPTGLVLVVTGFNWAIAGATANSLARVTLMAVGGNSGNNLATSLAVANSDGVAVGSITLEPGVVFRPAAGFPHLCIAQNSGSGRLLTDGTLQGYLAPDR